MRLFVTLLMLIVALGLMTGCEDEKKAAQAPSEEEVHAVAEEIIQMPADPVVQTPAPPAAAADPDAIVVTISGTKIIESQVSEEVEKRVQARMKMIPPGMTVPPERIAALRDQTRMQVADMLVDKVLINEALREKNITVTPEQAEAQLQAFMKENEITPEGMAEQIARSGMTMEDVREQFLMREKVNALIAAELGEFSVDEEEARAFYDENIQQFSQPELVTASHILLNTQGKTDEEKAAVRMHMENILKRAKEGEDFAALAKEYSEDPGSKDRGGEYTFPRGQMVKPFEDAAFGLENGKISDIVETQFGYHIIKKIDHKEGGTRQFEEVKEQLIARLTDQKKGAAWQSYQQRLHENADIQWSAAEQARRETATRSMQMPAPRPAPAPQPAKGEQP